MPSAGFHSSAAESAPRFLFCSTAPKATQHTPSRFFSSAVILPSPLASNSPGASGL
jgi:hypothetical protein